MNRPIKLPPIPLADRMRPKNLNEFIGQNVLLNDNGPIRKMIETDIITSFILWGPPGSGKTTLAKIISYTTHAEFFQLNAISAGVKDIRSVIDSADVNRKLNKRTILFIDEIHRFNKSQQDALLSAVETGLLILIGATTENPSFEIIPALRSRVRIFTLNTLEKSDLELIIQNTLLKDDFIKSLNVSFIDSDFLIYVSGGDARTMLNYLEAAISLELNKSEILISKQVIENVIQKKNVFYDKSGEEHFNIMSAFIKSMRGSDPDAAIYWLARMLEGGEDPLFISRRMIVFASEDIGNASQNALLLAVATFDAVNKIGMPEARIVLSQCATYLASSPKSNSSYKAIESALKEIRENDLYPVPLKLRNAPTKLMKDIGYSNDYKYPHDFKNNFILESYMPGEIKNRQYYFPTENGNEKSIKSRLIELWQGKKKY